MLAEAEKAAKVKVAEAEASITSKQEEFSILEQQIAQLSGLKDEIQGRLEQARIHMNDALNLLTLDSIKEESPS